MDIDKDIIDKVLTDLGLTKYEAMVYWALIKLGEAKAIEIAQTSGVPREKTYQVLRELEEKEIVRRIDSKPRKWAPMPPMTIFENVLNERRRTLSKMEAVIKYLQENYEKQTKRIRRRELNVWEIDEDSFIESIKSLMNYAKYRIYILASPSNIDILTYQLDLFKKISKKDVDIKIITWLYEDMLHDIAKLNQYIEEIYILQTRPIEYSIYLIDEKNGFIVRDDKEFIIQFSDSKIFSSILELFNQLIEYSLRFDIYIKFWDALESLENARILSISEILGMYSELMARILERVLIAGDDYKAFVENFRNILRRLIPQFDTLPIQNKVMLMNTLIKLDPVFKNTNIDLDIISKSLIIEATLSDDSRVDWTSNLPEYSILLPPSLHMLLIHEELLKKGWVEAQTIYMEEKSKGEEAPRKIRIIKRYRKRGMESTAPVAATVLT